MKFSYEQNRSENSFAKLRYLYWHRLKKTAELVQDHLEMMAGDGGSGIS